ncbi:MAG: hypothetical protein GY810_24435 [Aureispira sp.]|nr:hypothetical protein [Aureispira sp.]
MRKYIFVVFCLIAMMGCNTSNVSGTSTSTTTTTTEIKNKGIKVAGKEFVGAPTKEKSMSGCEGCGERGSFEFSATENKVSFIWSGSDIMDGGTYEQVGNKITIESMYGDTYTFTVSEDGQEITDDKYKGVFRDTQYPWK